MAKYICANAGGLFLPDGTEVKNGDDVDISKELAANAGVKQWIETGLLIDAKSARSAPAGPDVTALTLERDAAVNRVAELEKVNAELDAKVQALQADLEAATKPAT